MKAHNFMEKKLIIGKRYRLTDDALRKRKIAFKDDWSDVIVVCSKIPPGLEAYKNWWIPLTDRPDLKNRNGFTWETEDWVCIDISVNEKLKRLKDA